MDFGTDSALAATYKSQHSVAEQALKRDPSSFLRRFKESHNNSKLLKLELNELVDHGYTPSFLVATNFKWKDLQRRYGASRLLEIGFSWAQMRNCGIDADSACCLGLDTLNINADQLMELGPTIENIASMRLPLSTLKEKGFTMHKLVSLGLNFTNMNLFGYPLQLWSNHYDCNWKQLGFNDFKKCEQYGWSRKDLHDLSVISAPATIQSSTVTSQSDKKKSLDF